MRQADLTGDWLPHFTDRFDQAQRLVDDPTNNPAIAGADRELRATTLTTMRRAIIDRRASEQLLHGEPHQGNVLRTSAGLLFVDLETCCRGPIEFDIAHATISASGPPIEVGALYAGADQSLVGECWILMLAMVIAWRCEPGDDLPNVRALAMDWIRQLRAAATRASGTASERRRAVVYARLRARQSGRLPACGGPCSRTHARGPAAEPGVFAALLAADGARSRTSRSSR